MQLQLDPQYRVAELAQRLFVESAQCLPQPVQDLSGRTVMQINVMTMPADIAFKLARDFIDYEGQFHQANRGPAND